MSDGRRAITILVVEDEEPVRTMMQGALQRAGYIVLACATGDEALEVGATMGTRIDLLVTDVRLPDFDGRKVATALRAARPGLKVLYVSGYTRKQLGLDDPAAPYLAKPFLLAELVDSVRRILGGD